MRIKFCKELPQWIISSDIGAYHPYARTIYVRKNLGLLKTIFVLCHELLHYLIHIAKLPEELHSIIDKRGGGQDGTEV
ncbi:MAG: hypothetical protein ACM3TR_09965 [Caulobacteraceae bacterium]